MGIEGAPVLEQLGRQLPLIDPGALAGAATVHLTGRRESVRAARDFAHDILATWRLPELDDAVALVVSELVTNALRHGVDDGRPRHHGSCPIELELLRSARRLVCVVNDPSDAPPRVNDADPSAESGRGLRLVECFSDGWGWRPRTGGRVGKAVWATFRLD